MKPLVIIFLIFCGLIYYGITSISDFYVKYFVTDVIIYKPAVNRGFREFIDENEDCENLIYVYTRSSLWTSMALFKKCNGKTKRWSKGNFDIEDEVRSPKWILKYDQ